MKPVNIIILGGGWGGLTAAHALSGALPANCNITVVEKNESFTFHPSFLKILTGEITGESFVSSSFDKLIDKRIRILHDEVTAVDPVHKTVQTKTQTLQADFLIIALGAELYPEKIPGFTESCLNLYNKEGAKEIHRALTSFHSGKIAFLIASAPFRCPPAPYEATLLTDWLLRKQGVRDSIEIFIFTPEPFPMPSAGPAVGNALKQILEEHHISFFPGHAVSEIDHPSKQIHFKDQPTAGYDLLIGIPPHGAPRMLASSGITNNTGYIPVHPQTLEILTNTDELITAFPGVYALGDITSVMLMNGKYLPKGGVFAEEEAHVIARNIISQINGEKMTARFNGKGVCYVDFGDELAAEGSGDFYAFPDPVVHLSPPSKEGRKAKHEFERIFEWWFEGYSK